MSKSKIVLLFTLILTFSLFTTGCFFLDFIFGPDPDEEKEVEEDEGQVEEEPYDDEDMRETMFYMLDDNDNIVPIVRPIEWTEGIATKTLSKMSKSPQNIDFWEGTNLSPPLPSETQVKGMTIDDGLARVNFTEELLDVQGEKEDKVLSSVIYTLTEFDSVDEVELMVGGEFIDTLPAGADVSSYLVRDGLNIEVTSQARAADSQDAVTLYFISNDKKYLVPVTRYIPATDEIEGNAIYELMEGPSSESGLVSYISPELTVNNVSIEGSKIIIDVSNLSDDPESQEEALKQLYYTLIELDKVNEVEITVDGEEPSIDVNLSRINFAT
ncbi:GerMN domain-containing protein [Natranaerobius trueperi]|uniref:GerMN domain-containing protein n=1 Tax=Natranaerobius trueperi TaxID=759412 RepID=UPI001303BA33|nr:GerMN domain-containing protein [Natranaerobius trueperi]